jgi:hypothetical protein
MNEFEQLACDVRVFATEVRRLGYSSVANGHENQFLELSERMIRHVDGLTGGVTELRGTQRNSRYSVT